MKTKLNINRLSLSVTLLMATFVLCGVVAAQEEPETIVVTQNNLRGWSATDLRTGGDYSFVTDSTAPLGSGALQMTTDATNAAKVNFMHAATTDLDSVTELSYSTKQLSGPATADASFQLAVFVDGTPGSFTTFVYEPYWNGTVIPGEWQTWNVDGGQFWSSKTVGVSATCSFVNGFGGAPFYTLSQIQSSCPNAVVVGYGVNVGSYNPNYVVETDKFVFNTTTYDFERFSKAAVADDCKKGGWSTFDPPTGAYKNQGQCVSSVVSQ